VRVGYVGRCLHVRAENSIFDINDVDALGYILGLISSDDYGYERFSLTLLKSNLETLTLSGDISVYRDFLEDANALHVRNLQKNLAFSRDSDDSNVTYISQTAKSSFFIPRLELSPGLATSVGTEVGVFDYLLSLRANLYATLYDGMILSVMAEVPVANSKNFDEGEVYYKMYEDRTSPRVVNAMMHQSLHVSSILNTTSLGLYKTDYLGVMNQTDFTTTSGEHALRARVGYFQNKKETDEDAREVYLGTYRYFYAPYDLFLEVSGGKFWYQDSGYDVTIKRYFEDVAVAFSYQDVSEKFVGVKVTIPLTTRKLYRADYFQIKGKNDFSYTLRSTVHREDGTNTLNANGGITPYDDFEITSYYLNRDRLNASYIKNHLDRMRDIYLEYLE
jgi:hypothetical protein